MLVSSMRFTLASLGPATLSKIAPGDFVEPVIFDFAGSNPAFKQILKETNGGEGGIRTREAGISRLHTFQACSFNRSDTSPHAQSSHFRRRAGYARLIHETRPPRCALRASPAAVQIRSRRICRTREAGISRLHTFQACSFNRSDTSPHAQSSHSRRRAGYARFVHLRCCRAREDTVAGRLEQG